MLQNFGFLYKMDKKMSFMVILVISLLLIGFPRGQGLKDPRGNPNLSPFEQWRSAYDCLENTSSSCPDKYQLTPVGWVNVTANDTSNYCKGGCSNHTMYLLKCLDDVMNGKYKFESKQTVKDISYTITEGCLSEFTGQALYSTSSAIMLQVSKTSTYAFVLLFWLSISYKIM